MPDLSKVFLAQPHERGAVELRISAHEVVRAGMKFLPVRVVPRFFDVVLPLGDDGARIPVVLLARRVVAAFDQQDTLACGSQGIGEGPASGSRPNDDDVVSVVC